MKIHFAIIAACAGAFVFAQTGLAQAEQASGKRIHSGGASEGRIVSQKDAPHRRTAAPGKPKRAGLSDPIPGVDIVVRKCTKC